MHRPDTSPRFAEQYSRGERVRYVVLGLLIGAPVVLAAKTWFFPWLHEFSTVAHCREVFGLNGAVFLMYAVFVGLPLSSAIVVACVSFPVSFKTLRDGQYPPVGQKVMRPTRIRTGRVARLYGYLNIAPFACLLALSAWGALQARDITRAFDPARVDGKMCTAARPPIAS